MTPQQPPPPGHPHPHHPYPPQKSGMPAWALVLLIVGGAFILIIGVLAAIAIPAMTKYMRRSKTSEARVQLAKMFDGASAYAAANNACPGDGPEGSAGLTPPQQTNCNDGPGSRCVPELGPGSGGGYYSIEQWTDNPVWQQLGMQQEQAHYYHYDFRWGPGPGGGCAFTAQAFGDLDDDGVFSTYERAGFVDDNGVDAAAGLYIDHEIE